MNPRKLKVCILTSVHSLFDVRIFYKQARSLVNAGYEVSIIVQSDRQRGSLLSGVTIIPLTKPPNWFYRITRTIWEVWRNAVKEKADIYHFHDPELILVGLLLRLRGRKVIYDIHEDVAKLISKKRWLLLPRIVSFLYRVIEVALCRFFPLVLADASFSKLYPSGVKKVVVQNFPQLSLFPEIFPDDKHEQSLVYLGAVTRFRGINIVLEALYLLKQKGRRVHMECIGELSDSYKQELQFQCAKLGLGEQIRFHGRLKAAEAYRLAAKCAAGIAIIQPGSSYAESYPSQLFDYMALQLPLITSNFPLYSRMIHDADCGIVVNPQEPKALAEAIRFILDYPEEGERMGENGRIAIESRYNWLHEEAKLLSFYKDVIS